LANLVGLNAWAWRQEAALQARRGEIRQLLSRTFPRVKTIIDAPVQMERELALLRQASGALTDRDLEPMLALIGSAVAPGTGPTAIEYAAGETVVKGLALSAQQMASLSARLSVLGYGVRADGERLVLRAGLAP
jgi:general secretion pathway protein L